MDLTSNHDLELTKKINLITSQTTYSEAEAIEHLAKHNNDAIVVIQHYLGYNKKTQPTKSINVHQEIYKQIRTKMGNVMKEYNQKNPINVDHVIENFEIYEQKVNN